MKITSKLDSKNSKNKSLKFTQKKVISKDIGNISLDLSKEEEVMKNTPGLMENSMIENITAMNSIFEQKQSERLMLNNLNKLNINDSRSTDINNSNQTLKNLVGNDLSNSNDTKESPLDVAVIIKDSQEVIEKKKKKEKKIRKKSRKKKKRKKNKCNKTIILIVFLLVVIVILIIGLIKTYLSLSGDK